MANLGYVCNQAYGDNSIACINSKDINSIQQGIVKVFQQEGLEQIPKPLLPQNPKPLLQKLLSPYQMRDLVVVGLFRSSAGWTIIKTSRTDFLCKRAKNVLEPRLLTLAKFTGFDSFAYSFHDVSLGALLEASTEGGILVSGYLDNGNSSEDADVFYQELVNIRTGGLSFSLLKVSEQIQCINKQLDIDIKAREKELQELVNQYPEQINYVLSEYRKIHSSALVRADENLKELMSCSDFFWHDNNILYHAFTRSEKPEYEGVKLLFFKPKNLDIVDIWSSITSREDYGKELWPDIPF